jgi:protocatechuate 3,4-dioxygenase beta subunit
MDNVKLVRKYRALLLLLCGTLTAQNSAPPPPEPAIVEGVVVRQGAMTPIQGVVVSFKPVEGSAKTGTSSAEGKFTINGLSPGPYTVSLSRTGFVRPRHAAGPVNLNLSAGEHLKDITLQLVATSAITGRVYDENGQPKERVGVVPIRPHYEYGRQVMSPCYSESGARSGMTDETGAYRIYGLAPGDYYVAVADGACASQYFPDVSDPADAMRLKVQAGSETAAIDFHLKKRTLYTARFKLVLPSSLSTNAPLTNTQIIRRSRNGIETTEYLNLGRNIGVVGDTLTTPALPPGSYELIYDAYLGVQIGHASFDLVNRDIDGGVIVVRPNTAISGQIRAAGALPAGWTFNRARVLLRPLDGRDRLMTTTIGNLSTAAADGTFLLAFAANADGSRPGTIAEGRYQIELGGLAPEMFLASARYAGRDVLSDGLLIDGAPPSPLELTVDMGGSVNGMVRNAKNDIVADSQVVLIPAQNHRSNLVLFKSVFTDQYGRFSIRGVAPGDYTVLAWEDVEPGAWLNSDFLKTYDSLGTRVSVIGTSSSAVTVRVIPAGN